MGGGGTMDVSLRGVAFRGMAVNTVLEVKVPGHPGSRCRIRRARVRAARQDCKRDLGFPKGTEMSRTRLRRYFRHGLLPQLIVFDAVARLGSVTRAAEELYLAQPTIS